MQSLLHEDAIVMVQGHDVGDSAQCNQVQVSRRHLCGSRASVGLQGAAERCHQVERNADSGQVRTGEITVLEIRVDYRVRPRQFGARKVMVRDQHLHSESTRFVDALDAGDAVVDRDQEAW